MPENVADVIKHSVTKDDYTKNAGKSGAVLNFFVGGSGQQRGGLPSMPPPYWSFQRDHVLRQTIFSEDMWSAAVYIAATKMASMSWQIRGGVPLRVKNFHELFLTVDNNSSWVTFLQKHLRDFLLTDNGSFIEIVRQSTSSSSKIIGLMHLDSTRCQRTGDPERPIIYRDRQSRWHEMRDYQIIQIVDMPDTMETYFGVGFCAASRAYKAIYKLAALENYVTEKVVGHKPLTLNFVNNVSPKLIEDAIRTAEEKSKAEGMSSYMGAVIVANIDPTATPGVAKVDLAGLPERFEPKEERRQAILTYADALGLDPQEIDPELLASKAMGTGSQSKVIDDKASGKGLAAWRQQFTHALNQWVLPDSTVFSFIEKDYRDQLQKVEVQARRTEMVAAQIQSAVITAEQGKQVLVDVGDLPREFLIQDMTSTTILADDDDPDEAMMPASGMIPFDHPMANQTMQQPLLDDKGQPVVDPMTGLPQMQEVPKLPVDPSTGQEMPIQPNPMEPQMDATGMPIQKNPKLVPPGQGPQGNIPIQPPMPPGMNPGMQQGFPPKKKPKMKQLGTLQGLKSELKEVDVMNFARLRFEAATKEVIRGRLDNGTAQHGEEQVSQPERDGGQTGNSDAQEGGE